MKTSFAFCAALILGPGLNAGSFTTLQFPGALHTEASGVNDSGQIVGDYSRTLGLFSGFLLSGGMFSSFEHPAGCTDANGINNNGQIVGDVCGSHGFLLNGGVFSALDFPGAGYTIANGINDSGQIVGIYNSLGVLHGFFLNGGVFSSIDFPGAAGTQAYGINDSGQIVGEYYMDSGPLFGSHGFLLSGGMFTSFDAPGGQNTWGFGINNTGQIVGWFHVSAVRSGFVTTADTLLTPESTTILSTIGGLVIVAAFGWRRAITATEIHNRKTLAWQNSRVTFSPRFGWHWRSWDQRQRAGGRRVLSAR